MSNIIKVKDSNGNWIGIPALQGEPGITPHIGENGNWFIGEEDTGVKANIDLTPYATIEEVNQAISAIDIPANTSDLTNDSGFITKAVDNLDNYYKKTEIDTAISEIKIPTKVSELTNDSGFLTNTVDNLVNYYKKSETYTQAEVNNLINAITTLNIEVVSSLPTSNISTTTIYLKGSKKEGTNSYEEYIYVNGTWELIGTTAIDLSPYATKTYVGEQIAGVTKSSLGLGNVENKSSATIRGELTSANVTTALGYTPLKTAYTLPVATSSALGGIKSGTDITIDSSGNVSVNDNSHNHNASNITAGTLAAARLPKASASALGAVKIGSGLSVDGNGVLSIAEGNSGGQEIAISSAQPVDEDIVLWINPESDGEILSIINYKGAYNNTNSYKVSDVVYYNNIWFICHANVSGVAPDMTKQFSDPYWYPFGINKSYVDNQIANHTQIANKITSGTFPAGISCQTPTENNHLVNKSYADTKIDGSGLVSNIWVGTQAEYDAIATKSATTLYLLKG